MSLLSHYIAELRTIRSLGSVPETSYYPALATLLNTAGQMLSPKVQCVVHPRSQGAGIPDLALFSADQIPAIGEPLPGVLPSRGVIEAKGTADNLTKIVKSPQVAKYLEKYGQVLVTNLREFRLVTRDADGSPLPGEYFALADSEAAFWNAPNTADADLFADFLKRVLLANAPLSNPKDVAWLLASYAREARARVERSDLEALDQLRESLEDSLGIAFTGERGDHFFRSTLVQTLFYGIFSAWVLWHQRGGRGRFDWRTSSYELRVPMIRALFHQASDPSRLEPLGLVEVLDWAGDALSRVDRGEFFTRFGAENAVQYFYEPFLEAFDPVLRRELGVWYTPREIVRYQIERIDQVLKTELGIADGLADSNVVVLDPCCGTGAYLVEVIRLIHERLTEGGADILALDEVRKAVTSRIFGFEILPAPFVVAHLQLGLLLQRLGAPFRMAGNERAGVYLTNALTGWEGDPPQKALLFPELNAERDAAAKVKRDAKILVILGNPPYNGFAGMAVEEERSLSNAYRTVKNVPAPQGQGLNDLYVRFFRMAERQISSTGRGVMSFISNYSWLSGLSFTGMRERFTEQFDRIWIDNLHGDRIISEYAPDGRTSETIFATASSTPGIKVGTAIATMVRHSEHAENAEIYYHDFDEAKAADRRTTLLQSLHGETYKRIMPVPQLGLPFKPKDIGELYLTWHKLTELFPVSFPGVKTSRDELVTDVDKDKLEARIRKQLDTVDTNLPFDPGVIIRYAYRPLDDRWLYWSRDRRLLDRPREDYVVHIFPGNLAIVAQQMPRREWTAPQVTQSVGCLDLMDRSAAFIPLKLKVVSVTAPSIGLFTEAAENPDGTRYNLSDVARAYLATVEAAPETLFFHTLAILHSPAYRTENGGALQQDWARVPLPVTRGTLEASAEIGRQVAALLDTEAPVPGVTTGSIAPELRTIAQLVSADNSVPTEADYAITAGWGSGGANGVMPGRGKAIARSADADTPAEWGNATQDVYLNNRLYWRNVPDAVWRYTLGGYQVLKKWLSYREQKVLGRPITSDEARTFQQNARRIAALLRLASALDVNYQAVKAEATQVTAA